MDQIAEQIVRASAKAAVEAILGSPEHQRIVRTVEDLVRETGELKRQVEGLRQAGILLTPPPSAPTPGLPETAEAPLPPPAPKPAPAPAPERREDPSTAHPSQKPQRLSLGDIAHLKEDRARQAGIQRAREEREFLYLKLTGWLDGQSLHLIGRTQLGNGSTSNNMATALNDIRRILHEGEHHKAEEAPEEAITAAIEKVMATAGSLLVPKKEQPPPSPPESTEPTPEEAGSAPPTTLGDCLPPKSQAAMAAAQQAAKAREAKKAARAQARQREQEEKEEAQQG